MIFTFATSWDVANLFMAIKYKRRRWWKILNVFVSCCSCLYMRPFGNVALKAIMGLTCLSLLRMIKDIMPSEFQSLVVRYYHSLFLITINDKKDESRHQCRWSKCKSSDWFGVDQKAALVSGKWVWESGNYLSSFRKCVND